MQAKSNFVRITYSFLHVSHASAKVRKRLLMILISFALEDVLGINGHNPMMAKFGWILPLSRDRFCYFYRKIFNL